MTKEQEMVKEWSLKFGAKVENKPTLPDFETRKLRATLVFEEALELIEALGVKITTDLDGEYQFTEEHGGDLKEICDALGDLHYVAYCGTGLACGVDIEPVFQEIQKSNMSKLWTQEEVDNYAELHDLDVKKVGDDERCYLVKRLDGKVIKSSSYSPAQISQIINKQLEE